MLNRASKFLHSALPLLALLLLSSTVAPSLRADCHPKLVSPSAIPAYAWKTLDYVRTYHSAPPGFQGGRYFGNYGSKGEAKLPLEANSLRISYLEWDVHRKRLFRSRGPERIITGSDGRAWYTADHYCTFTEMK